MKKLIIPMLMLCIAHVGMMRAADTDVSAIDNVVYIESFQASPGTTALELSIKMKNTADIRGFQFDLVLPEGVTPVEDDGDYVYWLNADRAPKSPGGQFYHTLEVTRQDDGSYRFLSGAQQDKTFIGSDGEVAVILVNVAAGMVAGEYPITMKYVKLTETDINIYYLTEEVVSTLTVTDAGDGRIVLDETSESAPEASNGAVDVRVKRTINANEWSTICLPFAMTEAQVKGAFGEDVELGDFTGYEAAYDTDDNVTGLTVNFNDVTAIEANHPYIIKVSSPLTEFTVDGVDIAPEDEPCVAFGYESGRPKVYHPMDFIGTYVADFDFYNDALSRALFLNGNKFWYATENTKHMKAFRAYFDFDDVLASVENAASRIILTISGETDDIQDADIHKVSPYSNDVYDLQGRKVNVNVNVNANVNVNGRSAAGRLLPAGRKNVKKGLYIRNGKKEIVK